MIKVIFIDMKDCEVKSIQLDRKTFKDDSMKRMGFACEVNAVLKHFLDKLMREKQED